MTTTSITRRRRNLFRLTAHATAIGTFASLAAASMTFANPAAAAAVTRMSEPELNAVRGADLATKYRYQPDGDLPSVFVAG